MAHFYVPGSINGYPVVFVVDTGATEITIPGAIARNAGLRVGLETPFESAAGRVSGGVTRGNRVEVGPFGFTGATVAVSPNLNGPPLLGSSVLGRFTMTSDSSAMLLVLKR